MHQKSIKLKFIHVQLTSLVVILIFLIFVLLPYMFINNNEEGNILKLDVNYGTIILAVIFGIFIHELLHGMGWVFFTKRGIKSIKLGIAWKLLTPYCYCSEKLKLKHYIIGAFLPVLLQGILPSILAIITGSKILLHFSFFFLIAASGDLLLIYKLSKFSFDCWVKDDINNFGCDIFTNEY